MKSACCGGLLARTLMARRLGLLLVLAVCGGLAASCCMAGLAIQHDGTSVNGQIVSGQVWDVQSQGKTIKVPVGDIIWMAGTDVKRLRVNKRNDLLVCRVVTKELLMQIGPDSRSLPISSVDFLCGRDIPADTHYLRIEEFGDQMVWALGPGDGKDMRVELMPQGWDKRARISNPVYASTVACTANLGVRLTESRANVAGASGGGVRYVIQVVASMKGDESDGSGAGTCRVTSLGSIPQRRRGTVSVSFGTPFSMPSFMPGEQSQYFVGRGHMYLFAIPTASGGSGSLTDADLTVAAGKVLITRTASNVLRLPITITKPPARTHH